MPWSPAPVRCERIGDCAIRDSAERDRRLRLISGLWPLIANHDVAAFGVDSEGRIDVPDVPQRLPGDALEIDIRRWS